ncbi:MAG TPA: WYL domain-containing protein [Ruminococcus sp.]|nr:WYL domain-containing protein [Ruminococcus sp.]
MNIFSELYGAYFRIAAKLLTLGTTDDKTVREEIFRGGFRDSILFLPQKLIPGSEDWGLFRREKDGSLRRVTKNAPPRILTGLQKSWLKAKLSDPRIRLFMEEDALAELERRLSGTAPLYRQEQFRTTDRPTEHDPYSDPEYIANFRKILRAVKDRSILEIGFVSGKKNRIFGSFVMLKMEYSPRNDRFRVYCYQLKGGKISDSGMINIGRIRSVRDTGQVFTEEISMDSYFSSRKCSSPAVIRVTPERNAVERFMLEFASFEKHSVRDPETGEHTVELWYDVHDEIELLIKLLSFGPVIEIMGPERLRSQARDRVRRQVELLEKFDGGWKNDRP